MYCAATPLLSLDGGRILLKLEGFHPTGTLKDRIIFPMIQAAKAQGRTLLLADWGPFALSAAWACQSLGQKLECFFPEDAPSCFVEQIQALSVPIHWKKSSLDDLRLQVTELAAADPDQYQILDPWTDPENPMAYCDSLAEELWRQSNGSLSAIVCGTETCGCLMGCATGLKIKNPDILAVASPIHNDFYGNCDPLGAADPELYVPQLCDLLSYCSPEDACQQQQCLMKQKGILCGKIGGAALHTARELEKQLDGPIVVILPSRYTCY